MTSSGTPKTEQGWLAPHGGDAGEVLDNEDAAALWVELHLRPGLLAAMDMGSWGRKGEEEGERGKELGEWDVMQCKEKKGKEGQG